MLISVTPTNIMFLCQFQTLSRLLVRETLIPEIRNTNNSHSKLLKCVTHGQDLFAGIGSVETQVCLGRVAI